MPDAQTVCPRCQGLRRIGASPDDPSSRLCDLCGGAGWLDPGQVPRGPGQPALFAPGEAWALTKVGARSIVTALFWLVTIALPIATVVIVVTWWSAAHDQIRPVLELLPESVVSRTPGASGQPWPVAGACLALTAVGVFVLSRARRRALARTVKPGFDAYALGLARAAVLVGGVGLAATAGPIADGADLREDPEVFASIGHIAFVVILVVAFAVLGTRRLAVKLFLAHRPDLAVASPAPQQPLLPPPGHHPPPPPPAHHPPAGDAGAPPTFVDPATGRPVDPFR